MVESLAGGKRGLNGSRHLGVWLRKQRLGAMIERHDHKLQVLKPETAKEARGRIGAITDLNALDEARSRMVEQEMLLMTRDQLPGEAWLTDPGIAAGRTAGAGTG
jgi:hypothetical protein